MTGVGGDTGRGLRVASRGFRTWWKLSWQVVTFVFFAGLATAVWKTTSDYTKHDWHVFGVYALCEFMLVLPFDPEKTKTIRDLDGTVEVETISFIAGFGPILDLRDRMVGDAIDGALLGGGSAAGLAAAALFGLRLFGRRLRRGRRLRGGELATAEELRHRTMPLWRTMMLQLRGPDAAPYTVAGIPWPRKAETLHTIVSGTTGSGKTVLISDLVEQIRSRGERCIVYDKMGSYTETFFDSDRDILLNPLDERSPRWSPFLEARTDRDFDTMAHALIPKQRDAADPFWITAARQLFSRGAAVLWKQGETRNRVLLDLLLKTELTELAKAMADTETQSIVDPENPKTALSVRAMLTANIGTMDLLPDEGGAFSIREWIEHDGDGCLFLTSRGDQHASLRGLISTWLEIAVNSLLSLPHRDDRRMWVILDELPTLHQLPSLESGLSETRQFGGCFVLGVQVFSALRDLYGRHLAETISGLCGTRVVLAAPDKDTSEWSARSLGSVEMESLSEGVSYDTPQSGVTLSTRRDERPLVLPSEVSRLRNLSGYIKLPGDLPVARIRLAYKSRDRVAERFVPKADAGRDAVENGGAERAAREGGAPSPQGRASGRPPITDTPAVGAQQNGGDNVPAPHAPAAPVVEASAAAESGEARRAGPDRDSLDRGLRADAGEGAGDEEEWLVEEWATAAGPPDGWPEMLQREETARGGTTVPADGGGTAAVPGTRADGGDADGVSPPAAPGVRSERRPPDEADGEGGEDRKSWL